MADQLSLALEDSAPRRRRTASLRHAHLQGQFVPPVEALALEKRAEGQERRVLALFEEWPGQRLTPSEVRGFLCDEYGPQAPLLTSVRRALTNLTKRGLLRHHPRDRRPGPHGATESAWSLA